MSNSLNRQILAAFAGLLLITAVQANDMSHDAIKERLQPYGEVCVEGDECASAMTAAASGPRSAEDIYKNKCTFCHDTGAGGAPKLGVAAEWADRIAAGIDTVYANAINGVGGMPPMGTCADCSEDEIKITVDYILENSK